EGSSNDSIRSEDGTEEESVKPKGKGVS
ncbi:protein FAM161B isoform X1, partial [Tachysurus ichikawai]